MKNLNNDEVLNLLNQISKGNDKVLKTLYVEYKPALMAFFARRLSHLSSVAAEEVVNEIFYRVSKYPLRFNGSSHYLTFLIGVGKNIAKDWLRKEGKHIIDDVDLEEIGEVDLPETSEDILERLENENKHEILDECIGKLPVAQSEVMRMYYYNDLKQVDIAKILSIPLGTVKSRMNHGMAKVTNCVQKAWG